MARFFSLWASVLFPCLAFTPLQSIGADIYQAYTNDGTVRYASEALNPTYTLFLSDEAVGQHRPSQRVREPSSRAPGVAQVVHDLATKYGVDSALVCAIIEVESGFNRHARSARGAAGLMQLMPSTAARYGVRDLEDPRQNVDAGIRYIKDLLALYNGNLVLALAAYNAGEGTVAKYRNRVPPYTETLLYVPAVLAKVYETRNTPQKKGC